MTIDQREEVRYIQLRQNKNKRYREEKKKKKWKRNKKVKKKNTAKKENEQWCGYSTFSLFQSPENMIFIDIEFSHIFCGFGRLYENQIVINLIMC